MFEKGNRGNTIHGILLIALFSFAAFYIAEIPFVKSLSSNPQLSSSASFLRLNVLSSLN